jgi:hypothetical protein
VIVRGLVNSIVQRLRREGAIETVGSGRDSKWKLAAANIRNP